MHPFARLPCASVRRIPHRPVQSTAQSSRRASLAVAGPVRSPLDDPAYRAALRAPSGFHPHGLGPTNRNRRFQPETAHSSCGSTCRACPAPTPTRARHRRRRRCRRRVHRSLAGLHRDPTRYAIGKALPQLCPRQLARVARSGQIRIAASMHIVDMLYLFTRYVMPVGATDIASSRRCPIQSGRSAKPTAPGARPQPRPERIQTRGRSDCRGCGGGGGVGIRVGVPGAGNAARAQPKRGFRSTTARRSTRGSLD